jgi:hypothetical protein
VDLTGVRTELAGIITATGVGHCYAYAPDTVAPPVLFIDSLDLEWIPGNPITSAKVILTVQHLVHRNDTESALKEVEAAIPIVSDALDVTDYLLTDARAGVAEVGSQSLVVASYTVENYV